MKENTLSWDKWNKNSKNYPAAPSQSTPDVADSGFGSWHDLQIDLPDFILIQTPLRGYKAAELKVQSAG